MQPIKIIDDTPVTLCELDGCEDAQNLILSCAEIDLIDCSVELNKRLI